MPLTITRGGNSSTFTYGPDHERTTQLENNAGKQSRVFYGGAQEVQLDGNNNLVSIKTYWPTGIGVEIDRPSQSTTELDWTHQDRLGSIVAITDSKGNLKEAMGFDAWGSRRSAVGTTPVGPSTTQVTETTDDKGFTGQEMLDPVELVHLNGRVYDPLIGKFVSGDPHITDPLNGQNYNRYSYVLNNPTNDVDPTGFDEQVTVTGRSEAVCHGQGCASVMAQLQNAFGHMARQACMGGGGTGCVTNLMAKFNSLATASLATAATATQASAVDQVAAGAVNDAVNSGEGYWRKQLPSDTGANTIPDSMVWVPGAPPSTWEKTKDYASDTADKVLGIAEGIPVEGTVVGAAAKEAQVIGAAVDDAAKIAKPAARVVEQYALRAAADGWYPVMKRGIKDSVETVWLEAGEVWKFGTTVNPSTRYSLKTLNSIGTGGVRYVREFSGTLEEAITVQNMKIRNFLEQTGVLPPGNKIIN